ncbi:MAG: nucleotidyltransferase domain-containing protein, partial [Candidatus Thermoplasmatota archaeon]|nr:nucleotidyltransferase domain-containing protein [Candidatus Thermoplasmatota archaeon]
MLTSDVDARVLEQIRPTPDMEKKAEELARRMSSHVVRWAKEKGLDAEPMVVGSLAKHTYMEGVDIDLFVLFPPETPREELQRLGLEIGHSIITDGEERYAEHPYVHGFVDGHEVDVVPCYRLSSTADRMSAVDRTPFHTRYVLEHLSEEQRDHVILLKRFMKGVGVYGAEASVGGFSGYLCEL